MSEYPLNCWYQAGWSQELDVGHVSRVLLGQRMLFWRKADGTVAALDDRCPHRFAPLSRGIMEEDTVTCIYHGLKFDAEGSCLKGMFANEVIPAKARVRTYPAFERDGILWFWPGDREAADEAQIPDFSFLRERAGFKPYFGYTHVNANYQLLVDNLMDTTHIEFVHKDTFGGRGSIPNGRWDHNRVGDVLLAHFWMEGVTAEQVHPEPVPPADSYDQWIDMRWHAPSIMRLTVGTVPHGTVPETGDHLAFSTLVQAHNLTPETETTSHYFWGLQDNAAEKRPSPELMPKLIGAAFATEDKPLIEAVQSNMKSLDFWAEDPVFLQSDRSGLTARRIVEALIAKEKGSAVGPTAQ